MDKIKKLVKQLVKIHETASPSRLCTYLGIHIIQDDINPAKGYFTKIRRIKTITIDNSLDDYEKDFVLAHELGHCFLHKDLSYTFFHNFTRFNTGKVENEANKFAMYLILEKYSCEIQDTDGYDDISSITGIPAQLLYKYKIKI